MNKLKGFTLIELIIAISILSMLMFTGSYLYGTLSSRWDKEIGQFNQSFADARSISLLHALLSGITSYIVMNSISNDGMPTMFFVGKSESLLAVSKSGIVNSEYPEIFRLTAVPNKSGKLDLVYQAKSTQDLLLLTSDQTIKFENSFILLKGLDLIEFEYMGWSNLRLKTQANYEDIPDPKQWFQDYSGLDRSLNPEIVKITIKKGSKKLQFKVYLDVNSEKILQYYLINVSEE